MRQVHFAFRADGVAFRGGHTTYDVRADTDGVSFTPYRMLPGAPSRAEKAEAGAPLTIAVTSIGRDGRSDAREGAARVEHDGHLAIDRGIVVEHLRNEDDGLEQSFALAERPAGTGDLEVRLRVSGVPYAGESSGGHHFVDPKSGLGVRYGAATWVDARGERMALRVRREADGLVIAVPREVVDSAEYPAEIDPKISPEFGMDQPVMGLAEFQQDYPSVGFDGTNYFMAWRDTQTGTHIVGARVSPQGTVLDPGGTLLADSLNFGNVRPHVAGCNGQFLVTFASNNVNGVRVSDAGTPLDSPPVIIWSGSPDPITSASCDSSGNYLVVWDYNDTVSAQRISSAGVKLGNAITVGYSAKSPSVAFDGTNWLVTWVTALAYPNYAVNGRRVSTGGSLVDAGPFAISTYPSPKSSPAVAFGGGEYLVTWTDSRLGTADIFGARVTTSTTVLDATDIQIGVAANGQAGASVGYDGSAFLVAWQDSRNNLTQVYGARLDAAGNVLEPDGIAIATNATLGNGFECAQAGCLVPWSTPYQQNVVVYTDVAATRVSAGSVLDPTGIPMATANAEHAPSVASDGTDYLVVWQDSRAANSYDVYGARVTANGTVVDQSGIPISTAPGNQTAPEVAYAPPYYFVVWADQRNATSDIFGARVDATIGSVLDASGLGLSTASGHQTQPAVASDGTGFFVIWTDGRTSPTSLYGARVTGNGSVLDPNGLAISSASTPSGPRIAFNGTRYLATWATSGTGVRGNRVSVAGAPLDGSGFTIGSGGTTSAVASDGQNFAVAFLAYGTLSMRRVSDSGTLLDAAPVTIASNGTHSAPALTFEGSDYRLVWIEGQNSTASVYGTSFTPAGIVSAPGGTAYATLSGWHWDPAVASDGNGHTLLAYERLQLYPPYGTTRVHARLITADAKLGTACAADNECASGHCADGVCCNTACGGSIPNDCLACAQALGASADGSCTALTGTTCDDGNLCTQTDTCQAGICKGANPVMCAGTACENASCNPATGTCSSSPKADGTACDDGDACTQTDACQAGACKGANPVVCPVVDACHEVAACDPVNGTCAVAAKPDGTSCDDGDKCTQGDSCQAGVCVGASPVTCAAIDACHDAGTCDPATGACSTPAKANGTACDDGNACTQSDTCQSGTCTGTNPILCPISNPCTESAACDPVSGSCVATPKPNGTPCDDKDACTQTDSCQAGACVGSSPVICVASDACHDAGVCNPATGTCSSPAKADGTLCNDGNACTQTDTCQAGACTGINPVVCPAADACHDVAACDPGSGACAVTPKPNGTSCDDGSKCTAGDTCQAGVCTSGAAVQCQPLDECHVAGSCDEGTGDCTNPIAVDGTPCSGGVCTNGMCGPDPNSTSAASSSSSTGSGGGATTGAGGATTGTGAGGATTGTGAGGATTGTGAGGATTGTGAGGGSTSTGTGAGGAMMTGATTGAGGATTGAGGASGATSGTGGATAGAGGATTGTGGATTGTSTSSGDAPHGGAPASGDSGGCGCRTAGGTDAPAGAPLALGALALVLARRRRRAQLRAA